MKVPVYPTDMIHVIDPHACGIDSRYGVSVYEGIAVFWDEDHDQRILAVIRDYLRVRQCNTPKLLAVQEHEASLTMVWEQGFAPIPALFKDEYDSEDGDVFSIIHHFLD